MLRYRLRTLLILLAILPPLLGVAWVKYAEWQAEQQRQKALRALTEYERAFSQILILQGTKRLTPIVVGDPQWPEPPRLPASDTPAVTARAEPPGS